MTTTKIEDLRSRRYARQQAQAQAQAQKQSRLADSAFDMMIAYERADLAAQRVLIAQQDLDDTTTKP